jgi:hypothetical protein
MLPPLSRWPPDPGPPLPDPSSAWPPDAGAIFCGFYIGLMALGIIMPDGTVQALLCTGLGCRPLSVDTALASLMCASASFVVDAVPTRHGIMHALATVGPAAPMSTGTLRSPLSLIWS